ncbi:MAG: HAMP domain-containing histidine kinase [Chloroflexi bacterium]|nr:HAMP domain-containing histidine kinase [Chloroflexota bacterium]
MDISVLLVEDDETHALLLRRQLQRSTLAYFTIEHTTTVQETVDMLGDRHFDAILLDLNLFDSRGENTFQTVVPHASGIAIIVMTGRDDLDLATKLVSEGAQDYLVKGDYTPDTIARAVLYSVERKRHAAKTIELAYAEVRMTLIKEFIEDITHDLRTPMQIITSNLYLLRRELSAENEKALHFFNKVQRSAERIVALTEHIDELSQLESPESPEPVDLDILIQDVVDGFRPLAEKREQTLQLDIGAGNHAVMGYVEQLRRMIENLVANALHYTPEHGSIEVILNGTSDRTTVTISDTGIGIPEQEIDRIYKRFYRAQNAQQRDMEGSGLGLSIVRRIVQLHGGQIAVESKEGSGTTFRVALPRA